MALIVTAPGKQPELPTNPNLQPDKVKTIAVDTKIDNLASLITHVSGMKWKVDYFNQYLTADDETAALEPNRLAPYQQYLRIKDFEIRVDSALNMSQDSVSSEISYVGAATLYVGVIPNVGDVFFADIGDGRAGAFKLIEVIKKSILRDTTYTIEYKLMGYAEDFFTDILAKTIKTTIFVRDFVDLGKVPLLVDTEYQSLLDIRNQLITLPNYYYQNFFNVDRATLLIPDQLNQTYDWAVTKFVRSTVSTDEHTQYLKLKVLNCDDNHTPPVTVYDAILHKSKDLLRVVATKSILLNCRSLRIIPKYSSIRYSGISELYYPKQEGQKLGTDTMRPLRVSAPRQFNFPVDLEDTIIDTVLNDVEIVRPIIKPVTVDDYYVFSEAFYQNDNDNMSILETMVMQYLDNIPVPLDKLLKVAKNSQLWGRVEQFYYLPIMNILLSSAVQDIN
jgi:hypothetical protein